VASSGSMAWPICASGPPKDPTAVCQERHLEGTQVRQHGVTDSALEAQGPA